MSQKYIAIVFFLSLKTLLAQQQILKPAAALNRPFAITQWGEGPFNAAGSNFFRGTGMTEGWQF